MMKINKPNEKVLVVVAHPDDELLGVAGTLCWHREKGDLINILILANGEDSRGKKTSNPKKRLTQAKLVAKKLNAKLYLKNLPDNSFDSISLLKITKIVENFASQINPDIIYTHFSNDLNVDHRLTFEAVVTAARPGTKSFVKKIFSFETPSSTEWQLKGDRFFPTRYVDISKYMTLKKELLSIYKDELRSFPHPRSLEGVEILARFRGMSVGFEAAEAFESIREVIV